MDVMATDLDHIKKIENLESFRAFVNMDHGIVMDYTNLGEVWLEENINKLLQPYNNNEQDTNARRMIQVKHACIDKTLAYIYNPSLQDVENVRLKSLKNKTWLTTKASEKADILSRFANEILKNGALICQLEVIVRGILTTDTKTKALPLFVQYLQYYSNFVSTFMPPTENQNNGIALCFMDDESFLATFGWVLGTTLASGRNVILQTEPRISLIASLIVDIAERIGIPKGVIELLPGAIDLECIVKCPDIDVVYVFGNLHSEAIANVTVPIYKKVLSLNSQTKSGMIVFNDADLDSACECLVDGAWGYNGMLPWSITSVIVQEDVYLTFVNKLKQTLRNVKFGSAIDKLADISDSVRTQVVLNLRNAIKEAKLEGIEVFQCIENQDVYQPTLFIGGKMFSNNVIMQDLKFPALSVNAFRTINEATKLANNNRYGMAASIWTENMAIANEVVGKLDVANIWINCFGKFTASISIFPQKESGFGTFGEVTGFHEHATRLGNATEKVNEKLGPTLSVESLPVYHLIRSDLASAVTFSKSGYNVWKTLTIFNRHELLMKVATEIYANRNLLCEKMCVDLKILNSWISTTREAMAKLSYKGEVILTNSYEIKSIREPVGVICVDEPDNLEQCFKAIIGSLLLGNVVIIFNYDPARLQFYVHIGNVLTNCNVPLGCFNVIMQCTKDVPKQILNYKEVSCYFRFKHNELLNVARLKDMKYCYWEIDNWTISERVTKMKNVWSTIGDSLLDL